MSPAVAAPCPWPGSEFVLPCDTVILALGTTPNPILINTTPGLDTNRWGCVVADPETGATSRPGVFAGGDVVTGAATVILAMGAGQKAARRSTGTWRRSARPPWRTETIRKAPDRASGRTDRGPDGFGAAG